MGNVKERIENLIPSRKFVLVGNRWSAMSESKKNSEGLYKGILSLMLNIGNMVEEDKLHYLLRCLKGWSQRELMR